MVKKPISISIIWSLLFNFCLPYATFAKMCSERGQLRALAMTERAYTTQELIAEYNAKHSQGNEAARKEMSRRIAEARVAWEAAKARYDKADAALQRFYLSSEPSIFLRREVANRTISLQSGPGRPTYTREHIIAEWQARRAREPRESLPIDDQIIEAKIDLDMAEEAARIYATSCTVWSFELPSVPVLNL